MNVADSEVVASVMKMAGYELCEGIDDADAVFLNTCSVRENAENKVLHRLDTLFNIYRNKGKKVVLGVLGCMAERMKELHITKVKSLFHAKQSPKSSILAQRKMRDVKNVMAFG